MGSNRTTDPAAYMAAPGKTIAPNGVVVVLNAVLLQEVQAAHGAVDMAKRPVLTYHDTVGRLTQFVPYVYDVGGSFESHAHDGDQPMDELFYVLDGKVTFTYDGADGQPVSVTLVGDLAKRESGMIYFPAGVHHAAVADRRSWVIVVGVRSGDADPCDMQKGKNIPG